MLSPRQISHSNFHGKLISAVEIEDFSIVKKNVIVQSLPNAQECLGTSACRNMVQIGNKMVPQSTELNVH